MRLWTDATAAIVADPKVALNRPDRVALPQQMSPGEVNIRSRRDSPCYVAVSRHHAHGNGKSAPVAILHRDASRGSLGVLEAATHLKERSRIILLLLWPRWRRFSDPTRLTQVSSSDRGRVPAAASFRPAARTRLQRTGHTPRPTPCPCWPWPRQGPSERRSVRRRRRLC